MVPSEPVTDPEPTRDERVMSDAQRVAVGQWVRSVANMMRLRDHSISVVADPPANEAAAEIVYFRPKQSLLRVDAQVLNASEHEIATVLIHELAHLYFEDVMEAFADAWKPLDSHQAYIVANLGSALDRYVELVVNQVALTLETELNYPSTQPLRDAPGVLGVSV